MTEGREGGNILCSYILYSKTISLILSSLHICHFTTLCAVLFPDKNELLAFLVGPAGEMRQQHVGLWWMRSLLKSSHALLATS